MRNTSDRSATGAVPSSAWRLPVPGEYAAAVVLALLVCQASWPGFMSFDSVLALSQARSGITESGYPPVVSYVWWLAEKVVPGQGGMFLLQNLLVFLGIAKVGLAAGAPRGLNLAAMALVAVAPATLGPMLVVWKDVAFGGLMALGAGFAIAYWHRPRWPALLAALALLALASAYRLNALPGVLPVLLLLGWRLGCSCFPGWPTLRIAVLAMASSIAAAVALMAFVFALSTWRLPDFQRLTPPSGHHPWVLASDLLGISVCSRTPWLPAPFWPDAQQREIATLDAVYFPAHIQRSFDPGDGRVALQSAGFDHVPELQSHWLAALRQAPGCFLWHRWQITRHLIGANAGPVFYVTDPGVFPNDLGVGVRRSGFTHFVLEWTRSPLGDALTRVWLFLLLGLLAMAWALWQGRTKALPIALMSSACLYLGVGALLLPAADLRYQFWVVVACVLAVLGAFGGRRQVTASQRDSDGA
jgi:hypothetical protein